MPMLQIWSQRSNAASVTLEYIKSVSGAVLVSASLLTFRDYAVQEVRE
jgi:hypothetical protein